MFDGPPIDCDGKVDPSAFAVPEAVPTELEELARSLRSSGVSVAGSGEDITSSWAGLSECYTAPEAETLYSALSPVSSSGIVIEMATDRVAGAIEDFAESVRSLKIRWNSLTTRAEAFLAEIAGDDDWDKADGFFSDQSENVDKNTALIEEAARLTAEYNEAERTCANKINIGIDGRTEFVEGSEVGANGPAPGEFVYGLDADLSGVPMEWGAPAEVDSSWLVDVGDAVWDFGVGAVEGTGAMVGAHSSEGWFEMSWGDAMWEYHEDNIQSAASLVGMYDAESDSYGWAGGDVAVSAWKDLAHSVVPWEEWGDRPGYVIGTAVLNIGVMAAGAALSATGVGAAVGVPLMAWRGMAILDGMGGRGGSGSGAGSGSDIDTGLPANIPGFGGSGSPVFDLDLSRFTGGNTTSTQLADMNSALSRLLGTTHDSPSAGGAPDGPRAQPVSDASDEQPTRKPRPNRTEDAPSDEAGEGAQTDPTVQQLNGTEGLLDELNRLTGVRDDPAHTAGVSPDAKRDPGADWEGGWFAEDMPAVDELTPEQRANTGYGPDEPDRALARVGGGGDGDTLTASRDIPGSASDARFDLTGVGGDRFPDGPDTPDDHRDGGSGDRGADLRDDRPGVTNRTETTPSRDGDAPRDRDSTRDDSIDRRTTGDTSTRSDRSDGERSGPSHGDRDGNGPGEDGRRHPGLGPNDPDTRGPRRDDADADSGSRTDARNQSDSAPGSPDPQSDDGDDGSSAGSEGRTTGSKMSHQERLDAAQKYLKGQVWSSGKQFVEDFITLLNQRTGLLDIFYRESDGHRWSKDSKIGQWAIPVITWSDTYRRWIAKDPLPPPPSPEYLFPKKRYVFLRRDNHPGNANLDSFAQARVQAIKDYKSAKEAFDNKLKEHKADDKHHEVVEADQKRSKSHGQMTSASETYGEKAAASYLPDIFDGKTTYDITKRHGGETIVHDTITLPELAGGNLLEQVDTAPGSGNYQFDQVHPSSDGGFAIVEAKGDKGTSLGDRKVGSGKSERRVSQGVHAYLEATFADMELRGLKETRDDEELEELGLINEADLAEKLKEALRNGKLYYAEIKGITTDSGKHGGVTFGLFDVSEGEEAEIKKGINT